MSTLRKEVESEKALNARRKEQARAYLQKKEVLYGLEGASRLSHHGVIANDYCQSEFQEQLEELENAVIDWKTKYEAAEAASSEDKELIGNLKSEKQSLVEQVAALRSEVATLNEEQEGLQHNFHQMQEKEQSQKKLIKELEARAQAAETEASLVKSQLSEAQTSVASQSSQYTVQIKELQESLVSPCPCGFPWALHSLLTGFRYDNDRTPPTRKRLTPSRGCLKRRRSLSHREKRWRYVNDTVAWPAARYPNILLRHCNAPSWYWPQRARKAAERQLDSVSREAEDHKSLRLQAKNEVIDECRGRWLRRGRVQCHLCDCPLGLARKLEAAEKQVKDLNHHLSVSAPALISIPFLTYH